MIVHYDNNDCWLITVVLPWWALKTKVLARLVMIKSIKAYCLVQLMFEGNSNAILTAQLFGSPPTTLDLDRWSIRPCISHIWTTRSWMQTTVRYRTAMKGPQISFPNHLELFVIYLKKYIHNSSIIAFELLSIATSNCGNAPQKMLIHCELHPYHAYKRQVC